MADSAVDMALQGGLGQFRLKLLQPLDRREQGGCFSAKSAFLFLFLEKDFKGGQMLHRQMRPVKLPMNATGISCNIMMYCDVIFFTTDIFVTCQIRL